MGGDVWLVLKIVKTQKILFGAFVMLFCKLGFAGHYIANRDISREQKVYSYVLCTEYLAIYVICVFYCRYTNLILKILLFGHFQGQKASKHPRWPPFLTLFCPQSCQKILLNFQTTCQISHAQQLWFQMSLSLAGVHKVTITHW